MRFGDAALQVCEVMLKDMTDSRRLNQYMQNISGIVQWNVDLWDKDKILRVVSNSASPRSVEQHLRRAGYYCEELRD